MIFFNTFLSKIKIYIKFFPSEVFNRQILKNQKLAEVDVKGKQKIET